MCLKHGLGKDGYQIFMNWSQQSSKHCDLVTKRLWKGLKPRGELTIGSLYWFAEQAGWVPSAAVFLYESDRENAVAGFNPAPGLLAAGAPGRSRMGLIRRPQRGVRRRPSSGGRATARGAGGA